MSDDRNKRAAEIGDAIRRADDEKDSKRRADEAAEANVPILKALQALTERLDGLEAARAAPDKGEDAPADDDDDEDRLTGRNLDAALAGAQSRADAVHLSFGRRAPPPMAGERLLAYRHRLLRDLKCESSDFRDVDISKLSGEILGIAEKRIFADALAASKNPHVREGFLEERTTTDGVGRMMKTFYGQPRAWLEEFAGGRQVLRGINNNAGRS